MTKSGTLLDGRCIMLAEDEFLISCHLQAILEDAGASVKTASTVGEAVELACNGIDGALLDVFLADGEVFPAADLLAERQLPMVFHSGHANPQDLTDRYPRAKALAKPASEEILLATLAELMP